MILKNLNDLDTLLLEARKALDAGKEVVFEIIEKDKQRTIPQNSSLHKYCANIAQGMNDAGFTQRQLVGKFKEGFELPVTSSMIKDIFREVGSALYKKDSTKKLTTIEMQEVYRIVDMRFAEITGVRCEWPSKNPPIY